MRDRKTLFYHGAIRQAIRQAHGPEHDRGTQALSEAERAHGDTEVVATNSESLREQEGAENAKELGREPVESLCPSRASGSNEVER